MKKHLSKHKKYSKIGFLVAAVFVIAGFLVIGVNQSPHFTARVEAASTCPASSPYGAASGVSAQIPVTGAYTVWSRVMVPANTKGFYLKVDTTCYKVIGSNLAANQWGWVNFENAATGSVIKPNLTAGAHTISFISLDPSVKVDKALLVNGTCKPTSITGSECTVIDDAAPSVTLTAPVANATLTGTVKLSATAVDDISVSKVEFYIDLKLAGASSTAPYSFNWNTTTATKGSHTITPKAYDGTGHSTIGKSVTVNVNNPTPTGNIYIAIPSNGNVVAGTTVGFDAGTNTIKPTKVEFFLDNTTSMGVGTNSAYGWLFFWNSNKATNGTHTVTARATVGTQVQSSTPITITVNNAVGDITKPSAPTNLVISKTLNKGRTFTWTASTDNKGVSQYYIYLNGKLVSFLSKSTTYTATNLALSTQYTLSIVAIDGAGNQSAPATLTFSTGTGWGEAIGALF